MKNFDFPEGLARPETVVGTERIVLETPIWSYSTREVQFEGGTVRAFDTINKLPGATIVPWMTSADQLVTGNFLDEELLMIPQIRPNANYKIGWCFPAGGLDPGDEGDIMKCAARELAEEAGAVATKGYIDLGIEYAAVHFSENINHTLLAKGVELGDTNIESHESIGQPKSFAIGEVYEMTQTLSPEGLPYVYDGVTICSLGKAALYIASR